MFGDIDGVATLDQIELARDGQERVAHGLKVKPAAIHFPKQSILRVDLGKAAVVAALLIGVGKQDQSMEFFERPTVVDEPGRQIIEQFGVGRRIGAHAEITGRADQSGAEMDQPGAIDDHARGQRIVPTGDGSGEFQPSAAFLKRFTIRSGNDLKKLSRHLRPGVIRIAADEDARVVRRRVVFQHHPFWRRARMRGVKLFQFALQGT